MNIDQVFQKATRTACAAVSLVSLGFAFQFSCPSIAFAAPYVSNSKAQQSPPEKTASSGYELRKLRKVGLGMSAVGPLGLGGINLELVFNRESGMLAGYGGGPGYQSFTFQYKYIIGGQSVLPYVVAGYANWRSIGEPQSSNWQKTSPSLLGEKFLNEKQKSAGQFSENLIYPGLGMQYTIANGEWVGSSVYVELLVLADIQDLVIGPQGTLGYTYYF